MHISKQRITAQEEKEEVEEEEEAPYNVPSVQQSLV